MTDWNTLFENAFYMLVILNPASKILFLASYEPQLTRKQNFELSWKSSGAALVILILLSGVGDFILNRIFRVELYSLQITGGMVVFLLGWTAIREGRFIQNQHKTMRESFTDISLVPLAAPLIAGPGMIAAAISDTVQYGWRSTCFSLTVAILINFLLMLFSRSINRVLTRTHLIGPLIRLAGLIVAVVAMQMILSGIRVCFNL